MSPPSALMDNLMRRAIDSELNAWGGWLERHNDYEGYPRSDNVAAFLNGGGGGSPGHRVLCLDMPTGVYATHARVLLLPELEREAVEIFFCYRLRPNARQDQTPYYSLAEKCQMAGVEERSLRRRINRARFRIAGLPVPSLEVKKVAELLDRMSA